jgi:SAM-dependent methyltransferase
VARLVDLNRRPFGRPEAAFYEWVAAPAVSRIVAPVLGEQLRAAPPGAVLDIGCGGGAIAARLREAGRSVVGIDPSVPQLQRVRRSTDVPSIAATADALPLRPSSFAAVVSSCAVKHWPSRLEGLTECVQLLEPGGALVVVEIDGGQDEDELLRFASLTRIPPGLRRLYPGFARRSFVPVSPSAAELAADCEAAGATDLRTWRIPRLPFFVVAGVRPR